MQLIKLAVKLQDFQFKKTIKIAKNKTDCKVLGFASASVLSEINKELVKPVPSVWDYSNLLLCGTSRYAYYTSNETFLTHIIPTHFIANQ